MCVEVLAVDLLMDALADIARGMLTLTDVSVGVLVGVNVNAFAGVTAVFEFAMSDLSEEICC